ncbi:MAG: hypothetical protein ACYCXU_01690 [Thermoleophilia bacterium]
MKLMSGFHSAFGQAPLSWGQSSRTSFKRGLPREAKPLAAVAAALLGALLVGMYSTHLSTRMPLAIVAAGGLFWLVAKRPRWGVVFLLALTSTLVLPEYFTRWMSDNLAYEMYLLVLLMLLVRALAIKSRPGVFERIVSSPVAIALITFMALVLAKSLVVLIESRFSKHSFSSIFLVDRPLLLYLLFIPALLFFESVRSQRWLVGAMLVLGAVTAGVGLLSLILHNSYLGQFMSAQSLQTDTPDVSSLVERLRPPGDALMLFGFWIGIINLVIRPWAWKQVAVFVPLTLLMLTGVILEFNRSYIVPMAGLLLLAVFINRKNVRMKLLAVGAVAAVILLLFASATGTLDKYVNAAVVRYGTTFSSSSLDAQSLVSRQIEDGYAWTAISGSPAFGIPIDELYRPAVPNMMNNLRWYIHDAYIWFWTYFGLAGLAAFVAVLGASLLRVLMNWSKIGDPLLQATVLGIGFALVTLVAADFFAPKFYEFQSVPVVALAVGLVEAIIQAQKRDAGKAVGK